MLFCRIAYFVSSGFSPNTPNSLLQQHQLRLLSTLPSCRAQVSVLQQPVFCVVRSLIAFRLTSTHKDYCVVGTDAGKITILEYSPQTNEVRRIVVC